AKELVALRPQSGLRPRRAGRDDRRRRLTGPSKRKGIAKRSHKRASHGWHLAVAVEDRFDVVPVRVDDERCVIPGVVLRAKTRRAVARAAGFDAGPGDPLNGGS